MSALLRNRARGRSAAAMLGAALLFAGAACSTESPTTEEGTTEAESSGAFPVTIEHTLGKTTIEEAPTRVASVGIGDVDVLLALGVQPVLAAVWPGSTETGVGDWSQPLLSGQPPTPLPNGTTEFSIEAIAASGPDVIVAVNNAIDETRYQQLSSIAPTVLHDAGHEDWVLPWPDVTLRIGQAVGEPEAAEQLVADTEALVASTAEENSDLADKTGALVTVRDDGTFRVFSEQAARGQLLASLGLQMPEQLETQFEEALFFDVPKENLSMLDVDILVIDNYEKNKQRLDEMAVFQELDVVQNGGVVGLDAVTSDAVSMPNPVTIPFVLETFVEEIRKTPVGSGG